MIAEALVGAVATAIVERMIKTAGEWSKAGGKVRDLLKLDPVKQAIAEALRPALVALQSHWPESEASLFDRSFLENEGANLLADCLTRHRTPSGADFATTWANSIPLTGPTRDEGIRRATPACDALLAAFNDALKASANPELRAIFDSRNLEKIAGNTGETAANTGRTADTVEQVLASVRRIEDMVGPGGGRRRPPGPIPAPIPAPLKRKFVGRKPEQARLKKQLREGGVGAIVGVRGMGGIGKTELAIAVARALAPHFGERVIWLECSSFTVLALQNHLPAALGIDLGSDELSTRAAALGQELGRREPTLVVLDDLRRRHLADLRHLLPPSPPCSVLMTSRRTDLPHVAPDDILPLEPLSEQHAAVLIQGLLTTEAGKGSNAALRRQVAVEATCVPLALRLCALRANTIAARPTRTAADPPALALVLNELRTRRATLLANGEDPQRPDLSVFIAFDASTDDLDAPDQEKLRRLGVLAQNECPLWLAMGLWGQEEAGTRATLARLVDAGVIEEYDDDSWWVHDLVRDYLTARLAARPEERTESQWGQARAVDSWLDTLDGNNEESWTQVNALAPETESALDYAVDRWRDAPTLYARLAANAANSLDQFPNWPWQRWLTEAISAATAAGDRYLQRWLQRALGNWHSMRGEFAAAEPLLRQSLATAVALQEKAGSKEERERADRGMAVTQHALGVVLGKQNKLAEAEELLRASLAYDETQDDQRSMAVTQHELGVVLGEQGEQDKLAEAEKLLRASLATKLTLGDQRNIAVTQHELGLVMRKQGKLAEAEELLRDSLATKLTLGDQRSMALTQYALGVVLGEQGKQGKLAEAEELLRASLAYDEAQNDQRNMAVTQYELGLVIRKQGRLAEAQGIVEAGLGNAQGASDQAAVAHLMLLRGVLQAKLGERDAAIATLRACIDHCERYGLQEIANAARAWLSDLEGDP